MDYSNLALFTVAAIVLLGSPGPAIAALVAIGRKYGLIGGLRFYIGLQIGLASAAIISSVGLFSMLQTAPGLTTGMAIVATLYLAYLSYKIATSEVGESVGNSSAEFSSTASGGFLLGITNPKAYVAFVSLMASYLIIPQNATSDVIIKCCICIAVMIVVDAIWLFLGDVVRRANLSHRAERILNVLMGGTILLTAILTWL